MRSRSDKNNPLAMHDHRRGFVLVMALALIVLAAISLAGLARKNLDLVSQVSREQEKLQRRWGIISCQDVLLKNAKDLLNNQAQKIPQEKRVWPLPSTLSYQFMLGQLQFEVSLSDEDAKVNLNKVYRLSSAKAETRSQRFVQDVISTLERSEGDSGLITRIQFPVGIDKKQVHSPFQSWGQIYETSEIIHSHETARFLFYRTRELSCWGNGRLNIKRASDNAIRALGHLKSGKSSINTKTLEELLALRKEPGVRTFDQLLSQLKPKGNDRLLIRQLFTDQSSCQSLWVLIRNKNRSWGSLSINQPGQIDGGNKVSFLW